jgi:uncharacterized membrane protein (UPF0127 family)
LKAARPIPTEYFSDKFLLQSTSTRVNMKLLRLLPVAFLALLFLMAAQIRAQEPARIEPLTIVTDKDAHIFDAEVADTDDLRARGLMFRHKMPEDRAMLFDFGEPRPAAMWMKNTYVSLDMLFVRADGSIAAVAENTEPLSLQTISVQEPVKGVVEVAAGTVKRLGIKREDKVFHDIFQELGDKAAGTVLRQP